MRKRLLMVFGMALSFGGLPAHAQNLEMVQAPAPEAQASAPARGESMAQVEHRYGAPVERVPAVGKPPISRWVYPNFVVYFEGHFVIHAVATTPGTPPGK